MIGILGVVVGFMPLHTATGVYFYALEAQPFLAVDAARLARITYLLANCENLRQLQNVVGRAMRTVCLWLHRVKSFQIHLFY